MNRFTQSIVEDAALTRLESIGWRITNAPDNAREISASEPYGSGDVALAKWLRDPQLSKLISGEIRAKAALPKRQVKW